METTGRVKSISKDWQSGKLIISFEVDELPSDLDALQGCDTLDVTAKRHREKRSLNANALLWKCLGDIASALRTDKWQVYLRMLRLYGVFTYIIARRSAVETIKEQWRECEEIGEIEVNGKPGVQLLCYFGSHTYDTKEFSVLLDGVITEMKELGLETPTSEQMRRSLEEWERLNGTEKAD